MLTEAITTQKKDNFDGLKIRDAYDTLTEENNLNDCLLVCWSCSKPQSKNQIILSWLFTRFFGKNRRYILCFQN